MKQQRSKKHISRRKWQPRKVEKMLEMQQGTQNGCRDTAGKRRQWWRGNRESVCKLLKQDFPAVKDRY